MLTESRELLSVKIVPPVSLEVCVVTVVRRDGAEIARSERHRYVLEPGDDLSEELPVVVAQAQALWTPEAVAAWRGAQSVEEAPEAGAGQ
ncbi:hypothetical protein ABAZ39_07175 [Azospirillum argentinense]|uniref:Uncharacterized protein n=1 Tax=Azospirillum argentinense TaxID=2970906 RepID=A0A060DLA6_9PROT|nr:hypothetical protein [Azospirillum argentinense]AIB11783.1 hypothetical protein ABAZ39_07175 [Azospirillum argentinense]EZQ09757.1 hypothetical protein ABAZ39_08595 [Azospirillum argentinense]